MLLLNPPRPWTFLSYILWLTELLCNLIEWSELCNAASSFNKTTKAFLKKGFKRWTVKTLSGAWHKHCSSLKLETPEEHREQHLFSSMYKNTLVPHRLNRRELPKLLRRGIPLNGYRENVLLRLVHSNCSHNHRAVEKNEEEEQVQLWSDFPVLKQISLRHTSFLKP